MLRVDNRLQVIRGYTNTDSPITSDFTGVYHDVDI